MARQTLNDDDTPPQSGHNVSDDVRREFYKKALKAKQEAEKAGEVAKSANGAYRAVLKAAKAAGVMPEAIAFVLAARHLDRDALAAEQRETMRMLAIVRGQSCA
jgi:hypothetical protein